MAVRPADESPLEAVSQCVSDDSRWFLENEWRVTQSEENGSASVRRRTLRSARPSSCWVSHSINIWRSIATSSKLCAVAATTREHQGCSLGLDVSASRQPRDAISNVSVSWKCEKASVSSENQTSRSRTTRSCLQVDQYTFLYWFP